MVTNEEKQEILDRIDFKTEYERIGIVFDETTPGQDGWLQCHAVDRPDHSASAAVNLTNGFYTDLGSGRRFDFFELMQMAGGYKGFLDVVNHYREELGITPPPAKRGPKPKVPETEVDILKWDANGDRWCGLKSTNRGAVERAGGVLCRYKNRYNCVAFQVFTTPNIRDATASGYVVEQLDGSPLPKFNASGQQVGTTKCKIVAGTTSGLIGTEALLTIQRAREEGWLDEITLFKVEGITDMTALLARIPKDKRGKWLVLTNASGAGEKPKLTWSPVFTGVNTVVVHDCDKPGQDGAKTWCKFLKDTASRVRNVVLPFEITPDHGKDLKDFLTERTAAEFWELVEKTPDAGEEEATSKERANSNSHRIAVEYLHRKCAIAGHPELFTLVYQQGFYFNWNGKCYEYLPNENLQVALTRFCNELFTEDFKQEYAEWEARNDESKPPVIRNVTTHIVSDVMNEVRSLTFTDETAMRYWRGKDVPEGFGNLRELVVVENGIISVPRLAKNYNDCLLEHTPLFFNLVYHPAKYDPRATAPPWYALVEKSLIDDPNDISKHNVLQEFMGYCFIQDTSLQKFLLLLGEGSNGKSAILTGFSAVMGLQNISNVSLEMFGERFLLSGLYGKMVNCVDDLSDTDKISEGKLKSAVCGMPITSDRKNKDPLTFNPLTRFIFACNQPPRFQDKTNGIQRRMVIIPFNKEIPEEEKRPEFTTLEFWEQFKSGMLNWFLNGLLRFRENGNRLSDCEESETQKKEFMYDMNPAARFISENLVADPKHFIPCIELFNAYKSWCYQNGMMAMNSNNFGRELRRILKVTRNKRVVSYGKRAYAYIGVTYHPDYQGETDDNT